MSNAGIEPPRTQRRYGQANDKRLANSRSARMTCSAARYYPRASKYFLQRPSSFFKASHVQIADNKSIRPNNSNAFGAETNSTKAAK